MSSRASSNDPSNKRSACVTDSSASEGIPRRAAIGQLALGLWAVGAGGLGVSLSGRARADATAPLAARSPGALPDDRRLGELRHLDSFFPFEPPKTKEEWAERAALVRRRILVANGLWPMPSRGPIEATVHGRVERDEYTVDRVF